LKALWFGGGGILATWLAVSPQPVVPAASQPSAVQQAGTTRQPNAQDLNQQTDRLRARATAITLRPSTRNPFRFSSKRSADEAVERHDIDILPAAIEPAIPATPPVPVPTLSGVARKAGKRTAVITIDGQIYLVGDGDSFAGRYTVVKVDPETVLIRDTDGAEQRLVLP